MLVITVALHSAIDGRITEIAKMKLWNTGEGDLNTGNYKGETYRGRDEAAFWAEKVQRTGAVDNYPRLKKHVWNLVAKMLTAMGYG